VTNVGPFQANGGEDMFYYHQSNSRENCKISSPKETINTASHIMRRRQNCILCM